MTIVLPNLRGFAAPQPKDEKERLEELHSLKILDTASEQRFDQYTELVAAILDVPMAAISLVDKDRQWFKSRYGFDLEEMPRDVSFCAHTINEPEMLVITDAEADDRFAANPMVLEEPKLRFYAGAVIRGPSGRPLGTCCALDTRPKSLTEREQSMLLQIARIIESEMRMAKEMSVLAKKVKSLALLDGTTGLPNLALFNSRLRRAVDVAAKKSAPVLLAMMRVDRFDALHAALGRDSVGFLIGMLAGRVRKALGSSCPVGHTREDQLAIAVPLTKDKAPDPILENLLACIRDRFDLGGHSVPLRVSIGAAVYPRDAEDADVLFKRARTALWSMPASDRSGYRLYERTDSDKASDAFRMEAAIKAALERDEFSLVFQPKIDLEYRKLVGAEALIRWTSEEFGSVPPVKFIPVAEESGLIGELGTWVLAAACAQMARWNQMSGISPQISVNVTSYQLRQPDFCDIVADNLRANALAGEQLNLELTESTLVDDIEEAVKIMRRLRELGVTISIDDFGTGFSSLSYLRQMPIQALKIDRSFIKNVAEDDDDKKLVRSIVSMGHDLELDVVAEGVETQEQLAYLESIGCDQVQGYFFSRPLPADGFASFAAELRAKRPAPK